MTTSSSRPPLAALYRETRSRVAALASGTEEIPVPACPGWAVGDVISHLVAVAEDAVAGRLSGPPDEEQTAAQVKRFASVPMGARLAAWEEVAPAMEELVEAFEVWPALLDVAAHEQDIRGAIGVPGARDCQAIVLGARWLVGHLRPPTPLVVDLAGEEIRLGPEGPGPSGRLSTDHFEAFRMRLGRRSAAQIAAMDWEGEPPPVSSLVLFGPAVADIIE